MSERSASRTALMVAAYRARASERPDALISDPWARALAGAEGEEIAAGVDRFLHDRELWVALRTAWLDDQVRRFTGPTHGYTQVVVLGAGLDTRAARLAAPGVRFFEVDHPASQREKLERLGKLPGYPVEAATYVECDFEHHDFLERLGAAGFDPTRPSVVTWEGVTMYLNENAIRHSPSGSRITISLNKLADAIMVHVADSGPGIPPCERDNVLRPLYRLEKSRTTPGSGLGLSLAVAITDLHQGTLSLHDNAPGLDVCVRFPAKPDAAPAMRGLMLTEPAKALGITKPFDMPISIAGAQSSKGLLTPLKDVTISTSPAMARPVVPMRIKVSIGSRWATRDMIVLIVMNPIGGKPVKNPITSGRRLNCAARVTGAPTV